MIKDHKTLAILREYRIISVVLTVFVCYWGWDAYQFVNANFKDMSSFVIAFYISIVGLSGWCVKNWMNTKHNSENNE